MRRDADRVALLARASLVVSFFRATWCPYFLEDCARSETPAMPCARAEPNLRRSRRSPSMRRVLRTKSNPCRFRVLLDPDARVADGFGLAYTFPKDLERLYADVSSRDLAVMNASGTCSLPIPGHFVVAIDGTIVDAQSDPDYRFRLEPAEPLAVLDGLHAGVVK